jgi:hypothetical protein
MGGDDMPPMGIENDGEEDMMGGDMPNEMNGDDTQMPSEFDSNFDAGVEADEETDPKRFIQQLTGKLSQSLNSYNNENGEPDTELGKYVLGMLVKQGVKGMDEKDKKEIIKKINTSDTEEDLDDMGEDMPDEMPDENLENMDQDMNPEMDNMQMESKTIRCTKKQIFESFGLSMNDENDTPITKEPDTKIPADTKKNRRTKPFEAPKKFK